MIETRRRVGRSFPTGILTTAISTMIVLAVVGACTTALAQSHATTTILESAHDFSTGATAPGYQVTGAENHCEVCHGPPAIGSAPPEWLHDVSPLGDYDGADWMYTQGDAGMLASELTQKCMGCHEGDIEVDAYDGGPAVPSVLISGTEAFGANMAAHHPVDITYDAALALAQGALEDPAAVPNPQGGGSIADTLLDGGTLTCNSCHEQHNDRPFDLAGGYPYDDPESGDTSEEHNFLTLASRRLCFNCHTQEQPHDGMQHHIPGRADPYGDLRGSDMACIMCHGGLRTCERCHNDITRGTPWTVRGVPGTATDIPSGHHGGDRYLPYFDCAMCHADPLTGILTGNDFGTDFAESCYECHGDVWNDGGNTPPADLSVVGIELWDSDDDDVPDTPALYGVMGESLEFVAEVATNTENDPLAYQWVFGDGGTPPWPSHSPEASHTYEDYYRSRSDSQIFKASVSVTDGVNPPIYYSFDVIISPPDDAEEVEDTWTVTPSTDPLFDITFENHSGSLVGYTDTGTLSLGIEFVGVVFWMEMWMDLSGNTFWGTGDVFFGNVERGEPGSMSGVLFKADGTVQTFTGTGGAPPED